MVLEGGTNSPSSVGYLSPNMKSRKTTEPSFIYRMLSFGGAWLEDLHNLSCPTLIEERMFHYAEFATG